MKKIEICALCATLAFFAFAELPQLGAENEDKTVADLGFEFSGDFNFSSIYLWRGIMLDGDPVVQPGFYIKSPVSKFGRVKFGYWVSHETDKHDSLRSSEADYIADYTYAFDILDVSLGHTYYDFPDALPADGAPKGFSREFYAGLTFAKLIFTPCVYYYYDYGKKEEGGGQGTYTVLNLSYGVPVKVKEMTLSLDFSGHLGHNNKLYFPGKGGDAALSVGLTLPLTRHLSCKPNVNYSVPWGNLSDKTNGNQKDRFYGGIYLNYSF